MAVFGFILFFASYGGLASLFMGIVGAIGFPLFAIGEWAENTNKKGLMMQLERMSVKLPTCPKCGKEFPQGKYGFCPFCGASLEQK